MTFRGRPLEWVLIAKGIGIILVVVGHFEARPSPTYWSQVREIIYSFHMPLFFVLSGYLYSHHGKYDYRELLKSKTKRLMCPFVSVAGAFFVIKYFVGRIVDLVHPVNIESIYALFVNPVRSYIQPLWFVYALFLIFAFYPLARLFLSNLSIVLLSIIVNTVLGNQIIFGEHLVFGQALANVPFFVFGVFLKENKVLSRSISQVDWRHIIGILVLFLSAYALRPESGIDSVYRYPSQLFLAVLGSSCAISVSIAVSALSVEKANRVLLRIGYYSMSIYLFHPLFQGASKMALFSVVKKNIDLPFELSALIAITCGVVFPFLLEKVVLRKYWITRKFVLGLSGN